MIVIVMNRYEANQKLLESLSALHDDLVLLDKDMNDKINLTVRELRSWYYQHLLYYAISNFSVRKSINVPVYITAYQDCYDLDESMLDLWRKLVLVENVDKLILRPAFDDLRSLLQSQMFKVKIVDNINYWTVEPKM